MTAVRFASTPKPPYWVVVFTALRKDADPAYEAMGAKMFELATSQPGFLGIEAAHDSEGFGVTAIYYTDETSILAWKANAEHLVAQQLGKERWYAHYEVRVARVERAYGGP
jgi:heme-degrading monooxygenase HmoA